MAGDGEAFVRPGPRRVGGNDGQVWEIGGQMIEIDGPRVVEAASATARCPGPRGHHTGVKQDRRAQRRRGFEEGIEAAIVGVELLSAWVELGALQAQVA